MKINDVDMHAIQGVSWRRGDEIITNPSRPFISDLDDLPIPSASFAPVKELSDAHDAGTFHVYCFQPRLPGRLHVLY